MTRYHAHPIAHRRGRRAFAFYLRVVGAGAVYLFALGAVVFALWMVAP